MLGLGTRCYYKVLCFKLDFFLFRSCDQKWRWWHYKRADHSGRAVLWRLMVGCTVSAQGMLCVLCRYCLV